VVVNHLSLAAFAAENVGYPKICLSLVFHNHNIHMLRCSSRKQDPRRRKYVARVVRPSPSSKSWLDSPTKRGSRPSRLGSHQEGALRKLLACVTTHPPWATNRHLGYCLTLRRIYLMLYEYPFLGSYCLPLLLHRNKFRCDPTIALWC